VTALVVGALAGLGLLLLYSGFTRPPAHRPRDPNQLPQAVAGVAVGLLAAVGVWLMCGWPVLTLAALAGGLLLPRIWMGRAEEAERAGRSEAVAEVAAGLRDAVRGGLARTYVVLMG
jgi:Flp pilus assembly protein TadB